MQLNLFKDDEAGMAGFIIDKAIEGTQSTTGVQRLVRTSGSYISELTSDNDGSATVEFLRSCNWEEVTEELTEQGLTIPQCSYYRAQIPSEFTGYLGATTLDDLCKKVVGITMDEWDKLPAGPERASYKQRLNGLLMDVGHMVMGEHEAIFEFGMDHTPVDFVTCIVGPSDGNTVIYTWHPGSPVGRPSRLKDASIHLEIPVPF